MEVDFAKADGTRKWLGLMEDRLLERSTASNDNYTAIAVRFDSETAPVAPAGSESPGSPVWKPPSPRMARLARIGLFGILLIALEFPILQALDKLFALRQQAADLPGATERDNLIKDLRTQQQRLDDLQNQLRALQGKGSSAEKKATAPHKPGPTSLPSPTDHKTSIKIVDN